jgi:hypothetical protein
MKPASEPAERNSAARVEDLPLPHAGEDDDALDLAAIELHRRERMVPLERLVQKYRR